MHGNAKPSMIMNCIVTIFSDVPTSKSAAYGNRKVAVHQYIYGRYMADVNSAIMSHTSVMYVSGAQRLCTYMHSTCRIRSPATWIGILSESALLMRKETKPAILLLKPSSSGSRLLIFALLQASNPSQSRDPTPPPPSTYVLHILRLFYFWRSNG